ncbi:D-glycerate dehydrogenase [Bacillus sp. FJAT-29814]|uniref:2-hydroxyacid dehydrogenase n=1 Tax=Bacillus sp. FJAT-29814 TaxID=1729688 RepID=UPI0008318C9A|nr:D-glycerate dehydrogenase [Bacillus sp. FJAT-29814]
MKPYVFITRKLPEEAIKPLLEKFEVHMWEHEAISVPRDVLLEEAAKADALFTMLTEAIDEELLTAGKNLKVIANMAVGYDNVDVAAATRKGIAICNTPDVLTDATADLTFGLLMTAARRIVEAAELVKQGNWQNWSPLFLAGKDVHHKTIGIVGMGKIGETVAKRATGFDMNILYYNRTRKPEAEEKLGAVYVSFDELLSKSDYVVCLTPLTPETRGMFSREVFRKMKSSAIFVNAARGAVVDETALYEALMAVEIAGAGLDVFEREPIRADHPLLTLPNVVALPHIGSATLDARTDMMQLCAENIEAILEGRAPKTLVNREWLTRVRS